MLAGHRRSQASDYVLSLFLAAIAGATNAGGFLALGQYTSHMTGHLSQVADNLALGNVPLLLTPLVAIMSFLAGAAFSAFLVNWARHRMGRKHFALPLAVEGAFLTCFALAAISGAAPGPVPALACLCFIMGMQNATITKISGARIRTTHATGMITDIGIEIGRATYGLLRPGSMARAEREKLRILSSLVGSFALGGLLGALGYLLAGFSFALPLAALLFALSLPALLRRPRRSAAAGREALES